MKRGRRWGRSETRTFLRQFPSSFSSPLYFPNSYNNTPLFFFLSQLASLHLTILILLYLIFLSLSSISEFLFQQLSRKKLELEVCSRSCKTPCSIRKIRGVFDFPSNHFLNFRCSSFLLCCFHSWLCCSTFLICFFG